MSNMSYETLVTAPTVGAPLVFAFHGTGGDEQQLFELAEQLVPGAGVVSPRGDVFEMGAARFFRRTAEGVYDMDDLARARTKMHELVMAHRARHPDSPVYAFGYSNGANILAAVFLDRPDLFDRVALLHPLVTWDPVSKPEMKDRKVLITGGRHDPIASVAQTDHLIGWFRAAGADVWANVHDGGHEVRSSETEALATFFAS